MVGRYEEFDVARATLCVVGTEIVGEGDVVVLIAAARGVVLPWCVLGLVSESALFHVGIAAVACADAVVGHAAAVETVQCMHLAKAYARSLETLLSLPPQRLVNRWSLLPPEPPGQGSIR